jgi:tetratricopeptide (TPR) repeat protein
VSLGDMAAQTDGGTTSTGPTAAADRSGIDTGVPGVVNDARTLLPRVVDEEVAEQVLAGDDPCDRVVVLLARGDYLAAGEVVAETRLNDPRNFRMRVLDADVFRASGDPQRAIERLRSLLSEFAGTEHEAVLQQHLGVLYFTTGDYRAAVTRFRTALALRVQAGVADHLVNSSSRSLAAAELRLDGVR